MLSQHPVHRVSKRITSNVEECRTVRPSFCQPLISSDGYTPAIAKAAIEVDHIAAIAFGRLFIFNPDLVSRIQTHTALNAYDRKTFYGDDAHGYTDYPTLDAAPATEQLQSVALLS